MTPFEIECAGEAIVEITRTLRRLREALAAEDRDRLKAEGQQVRWLGKVLEEGLTR